MTGDILCPFPIIAGHESAAVRSPRKGRRCVLTAITPQAETTANAALSDLSMMNKTLVGRIFGAANPRADFPRSLGLY
ncbi:hypothetical protein BS297_11685 [Rhodococcus erythropolis]|uniref:Uncharacterized protein n=1 Tax=Rhodococcus erythropolis TaxID=1833 RepID=A0A0C3A2C9_RHOER|nr:hypothetical protein BS297_11685 [Rhodococcus erythropolis]KIM14424.1 hypothetical protein QV65_32245 [Rhodococcus erythropolis]